MRRGAAQCYLVFSEPQKKQKETLSLSTPGSEDEVEVEPEKT